MKIFPPPLQQVDRTSVWLGKRRLTYFGGCDYFRLASHPDVLRAFEDGAKKFGLNVAASRRTTGNHRLYEVLEDKLAAFFAVESALLVSCGYLANLAVAQALSGQFSHAIIDERAHSSLQDATKFLDCPVIKFKHRDAADLERAVNRCGQGARLILLTDGMFGFDGSIAPLKTYQKILPADGWLLVDEAHSAGVLGQQGRGAVAMEGVDRRRLIQTITLSKAFGVFGGAVLGARSFKKSMFKKSGLFAGATPLPLPLANAALCSLYILETDKSLGQQLRSNIERVKSALRDGGFEATDSPSPIIPVVPRHPREAAALRRDLLARRIHPPFIQYPGGPATGFFRFAVSSEHSPAQLEALVAGITSQAL